MRPINFIKQNIIFSVIIIIGLSIFLIGIIGNILIENKINYWPEEIPKRINTITEEINNSINLKQQKLLHRVTRQLHGYRDDKIGNPRSC